MAFILDMLYKFWELEERMGTEADERKARGIASKALYSDVYQYVCLLFSAASTR